MRLFSFALPAALLIGCPADPEDTDKGGGDTDTGDTDDTDTDDTDTDSGDSGDVVPSGAIVIDSPVESSSLYPGVTVSWSVTDFVLDAEALGGTDEDGHGHVHVYVDGGDYFATTDSSVTFEAGDLAPGEHTVEVHLASNSHNDLVDAGNAAAMAVVHFYVVSPTIAITSPADAESTDSAGVEITYSVGDFTVSENVEGPNAVGEGHIHLMLDGIYYDYTTNPTSARFLHLSPGKHTLGAMLVNNDHTDLYAGTPSAEVSVDVPEDAADIRITNTIGTDYDSATVPVSVMTENLLLDSENVGGSNAEGAGHYHIYVDGVYADLGLTLDQYVRHVAPGEHTLEVVVANNDHSELGARDHQTFSVAADRPDVTITSPGDGESVGADFYVMATEENFTLSEDVGGANVTDEGHMHLLVDGAYYAISTNGQFEVHGLSSGNHVLTVGLQNNDHTDLSPLVYDYVTVTAP
jgi:hypothetical protein